MLAELLFRFQKPLSGFRDHPFPQGPGGGHPSGQPAAASRERAKGALRWLSPSRSLPISLPQLTTLTPEHGIAHKAQAAARANGSPLILVLNLGFIILPVTVETPLSQSFISKSGQQSPAGSTPGKLLCNASWPHKEITLSGGSMSPCVPVTSGGFLGLFPPFCGHSLANCTLFIACIFRKLSPLSL